MNTIPHSEEIERIVIGDCLINKALSHEMRELSVADFFFAENQKIWSVVCEIDEEGEQIEVTGVHARAAQRFPGFAPRVSELANLTFGVPAGSSRRKQINALKRFSTLRYLQKSFAALSEKCEKLETVENLIVEAENLLKNVKAEKERESGTSRILARVIDEDVAPRLDKFVSGESVKIPFGFSRLDESTNGGAGLGELVILGAKPKQGKSAMMMQIANSIAQNGTAVYACSREMLNFENAFRLIAQNSKYTLNHFRPNLFAETRNRILEDVAHLRDAPLFLDDKAKSVADIRREVLRLREENYDIKAIMVDYVQLMKGDKTSRYSSKADVLEEIIYELKDLSVELEAAVFTAAQFNRDGIDSARPKMSDFAGSSAIEKAGNLILLWQINQETNSLTGAREGELWIEAGRNVAYDEFAISFYGESAFRFEMRKKIESYNKYLAETEAEKV